MIVPSVLTQDHNIKFHKHICCGSSLELPQGGSSNEGPQHMFYGEGIEIISCGTVILNLFYHQGCVDGVPGCTYIHCTIGHMKPQDSVEIKVRARIWTASLIQVSPVNYSF